MRGWACGGMWVRVGCARVAVRTGTGGGGGAFSHELGITPPPARAAAWRSALRLKSSITINGNSGTSPAPRAKLMPGMAALGIEGPIVHVCHGGPS